MKVVVAPNSMKGSLNAFDFADAVEQAFLECSSEFEIRKIPVADGGDFTGEVLMRNLGATEKQMAVVGPLRQTVLSKYAVSGVKAIIEMADASGMKLVRSSDLDPLVATSYGTGQLIADALKNGCTEIYLAIGGSATVDGGMGMMEALGFVFSDKDGATLAGNGANLCKIHAVKSADISEEVSIKIICDVDNPLLGENGAANVFGPQKGATKEMVPILEEGLENWARVILNKTGHDLKAIEGTGAAGGMALPLMGFLNAEIVPGADFVLEQLKFAEQVSWADIVITGEGKIDSQTLNNKAPFAVAKSAKKYGKPVFAIGGKVESFTSDIFDGVYSLVNGPLSLEYAMNNAQQLLYNFSKELAKTIYALRIKEQE
ncbi:glycerate kinase [uncultured Draconibacterium sp.]|uniref:glycerate kinase n=1 Tax=uncultured Draconibacterium sp. TaxID=1573823 RepID=UPI003217E070